MLWAIFKYCFAGVLLMGGLMLSLTLVGAVLLAFDSGFINLNHDRFLGILASLPIFFIGVLFVISGLEYARAARKELAVSDKSIVARTLSSVVLAVFCFLTFSIAYNVIVSPSIGFVAQSYVMSATNFMAGMAWLLTIVRIWLPDNKKASVQA